MAEPVAEQMTGIHALLPIKDLSGVKSRLGNVLDLDERRALVRAMAEDVVAALQKTRNLNGIHVVTHDSRVVAWARAHHLGLIDDTRAPGLSPALALGAQHLAARGARSVLIVLADTPLSSAQDFEAMIEACGSAAPGGHMILSPSRDGDGSNAMLLTPPGAMAFHYGVASAGAHVKEAEQAGLQVVEVKRAGIAHDVDTQKDLIDLIDLIARTNCLDHHSRTGDFLTSSGIAARMSAQKE